jgi:phosphoribosylcarboxyaminoimidazole (NCAIR) mutase
MEGALPSVVGGLVAAPVIAVPTSVGYGAAFGGLAALLGMLNSCSPNVCVVNIDNGFGAAYVAAMVVRQGTGLTSQISEQVTGRRSQGSESEAAAETGNGVAAAAVPSRHR